MRENAAQRWRGLRRLPYPRLWWLKKDYDHAASYVVDFGNTSFNCDCFGFVGLIFNLQPKGDEFLQILEIIDRELSLNLADNHDRIREIKRRFPEVKTANEINPIMVSPQRKEVSSSFIPPVVKEFSIPYFLRHNPYVVHIRIITS
jgi:hypothetical protein